MDLNNFFHSGFDFTENEHQLQFRYKLLNIMLLIAIFAGLITAYMYHGFAPFEKIYLTQRNCIFSFIVFILIFVARFSKSNYFFVLYLFLFLTVSMFTHALFFQVENTSIIFWFAIPILLSYFVGNAFAGKIFTILIFAILI
ncbi:MAG: hypothetical protein OEW60_08010, partial [Thiovulaceae bacterium]|nr:hypothetical protein [Sulfurimonadaceae bacterium]